MPGAFLAVAPCYACGLLFSFDPDRVPSLVVDGRREPLCMDCVARANELRRESGEALIYPLPGAYGPAEEE